MFHLDLFEGTSGVTVSNLKPFFFKFSAKKKKKWRACLRSQALPVCALICAGKERKWRVGWQIWRRERDYRDTGSIGCHFCNASKYSHPFSKLPTSYHQCEKEESELELLTHYDRQSYMAVGTIWPSYCFTRWLDAVTSRQARWKSNNLCITLALSYRETSGNEIYIYMGESVGWRVKKIHHNLYNECKTLGGGRAADLYSLDLDLCF